MRNTAAPSSPPDAKGQRPAASVALACSSGSCGGCCCALLGGLALVIVGVTCSAHQRDIGNPVRVACPDMQ